MQNGAGSARIVPPRIETVLSTLNDGITGGYRWALFAGLAVLAVGIALAGWYGWRSSGAGDSGTEAETREVENPLEQAKDFYETRPYYQTPQPHTETPEGLSDIRAETCGSCHEEIYEEWKISTHRRAWTQDPQFMKELEKSRTGGHAGDGSDDVSWMCVTCHTPKVNQIEQLVVGLKDGDVGAPIYVDNPSFDPKLQDEAITCASCHVRNGKVYGPWGDTNAPHPTARDPDLQKPKNCTQCHQANAKWPSRNLACFFDTGKQFADSPYAREGKSCQSCHMPKVERKLAKGYDRPKRETRRHWFGGSLIAKRPKYVEEMKELRSVYGSGAEIEVLNKSEASDVRTSTHGRLEESACDAERCRTLVVRIVNANAGHKLPTGDPERHIDVEAVVRTPDGERVTRAKQRIASKYEWWPEIEKQYDNRLDPKQHLDFELHVPADLERVAVDVRAHKYRMYTEAYEHHELEGVGVRGRRFHRSSWKSGEGSLEQVYLDNDEKSTGSKPQGFFAGANASPDDSSE